MAFGWVDITWSQFLVILLVITHLNIFSVTLFLHRSQAHRAVDFHPIMSHFFRFWLWLGTSIVTKQWVAVHRKHHTCSDQPGDPHSPRLEGLKEILFFGLKYYRRGFKDPETLKRYSAGTPDDWLEDHLYTKHRNSGIFVLLGILTFLFGFKGMFMWLLVMAWIPFWAAGVINGVGHYWGYRRFECNDTSTNISPIGILIGGEELHNNHHAYPASAKFSVQWYEFDIGWLYLKILSFLGLAKIKRTIPDLPAAQDAVWQEDAKAIDAFVHHNSGILQRFSDVVVKPEMRSYFKNKAASGVLKRKLKRLMMLDVALLRAMDHELLQKHLDAELKTIYEFRKQLHDHMQSSKEDFSSRVAKIRAWHQQAHDSGIAGLQDFARWLGQYLPPVEEGAKG